MTAQHVSRVLKRHVESAGLGPEACSAHSLRAGFITQSIREGKPEQRVKEHSGPASRSAFNPCARGSRDLSVPRRRNWTVSLPKSGLFTSGSFLREKPGRFCLVYVASKNFLRIQKPAMKSKLTLRLDDDLKERAKQLADERGISVSRLVEDYFRLLLQKRAGGDGRSSERSGGPEVRDKQSSVEEALSPRIQALKEDLGQPAPAVEMDEDTKRWIDAAAEKHR